MLTKISIVGFVFSLIATLVLKSMKKRISPEYLEARTKALSIESGNTTAPNDKVLKVVMEVDTPGSVITSVVTADGNYITLHSTQQPHAGRSALQFDNVKKASFDLLELAKNFWTDGTNHSATDFPFKNEVRFYIISNNKRVYHEADLAKSAGKGHKLKPLYDAFVRLNKEWEIAVESHRYSSGSRYVVTEY